MTEEMLIQSLLEKKKEYERDDQKVMDEWIGQLEDILLTKKLVENPAVQKLLQSMRERIETINQQLTFKVGLDTFSRVVIMTERDWINSFLQLFDTTIKEKLQKEITKL